MALQVWLPFTDGTLKQQGFLNSAATVTGTTTFVAGKLGQALNCNGSSWWTIPNVTLDSNVSIACWSKTTTNSKMMWVLESDASEILNLFDYGEYYLNTGDSANNPYLTDAGSKITCLHDGAWHHFVITFNGTQSLLYIDGEYKGKAKTYRNPTTTNKNLKIGGGYRNAHSYDWNGALNDFRLYDHCLSPMEVKEISKGLVLHYPLNRQGWGQENLASPYIMPGGNNPGTTSSSGRTKYYGDYGISIPATESADTYFSIWYSEPLESGATYTLSAEVSGLLSGSYYNFPLFAQNNSSMGIFKINHNGLNTLTFTMNYTGTIVTTTYNGKTYYRMFMDDVSRVIASGQGAVTIKNIKLEKGSVATPWCPNSSDTLATTMGLNSTTEYDCSGFCNNGTRTGTFTWTSDTPKYNVSQYFNNPTGTSTLSDKIYISASPNLYSPSAITVGFWFKKEAITRGGLFTTGLATTSTTTLAIHDYDSNVKVISSDNTTLSMGSYDSFIPSTSIWYYYVITFDGINAKIYINGDLKTTKSYSETKTLQNIIDITLGANSAGGVYRSAKGYYSDFRIYATALSADDVKSLYQNSAYIDSSGNVYGAVHSEV